MRSDRMWSLPISPAAAIIYESIHSGALNGTVGTPAGVIENAPSGIDWTALTTLRLAAFFHGFSTEIRVVLDDSAVNSN